VPGDEDRDHGGSGGGELTIGRLAGNDWNNLPPELSLDGS